MAFERSEADHLLAACRRRCCVCHRFCGVKIELHHLDPSGSGGGDDIDNAIPVCFECHAEIRLYNDAHPRGRKFHPEELRAHKEQWLRVCKESPGALLLPQRSLDVGPIQALIDELEFNSEIGQRTADDTIGALVLMAQFERAIQEGVFSLLPDSVRSPIAAAYATLMRANMSLQKMATMPWGGSGSAWHHAYSFAQKAIIRARSAIPAARATLLGTWDIRRVTPNQADRADSLRSQLIRRTLCRPGPTSGRRRIVLMAWTTTDVLTALLVVITGVYAVLTYGIMAATRRSVGAMQQQTDAMSRRGRVAKGTLHYKSYILTGTRLPGGPAIPFWSSRKMGCRSVPRTMTWCTVPGQPSGVLATRMEEPEI